MKLSVHLRLNAFDDEPNFTRTEMEHVASPAAVLMRATIHVAMFAVPQVSHARPFPFLVVVES